MRYWLHKTHVQFDLILGGNVEQIIGTMIEMDEIGLTVMLEAGNVIHSYTWSCVQHATQAP